ncbi:Lipase [Parasponia andersonii]|uniref:Lipase n=1 Tax=Parasponia andersonii TaxID=3476 RepID=A0A2P5CTI0_PARAD|nr:Lipase [Parasponia andersonii]
MTFLRLNKKSQMAAAIGVVLVASLLYFYPSKACQFPAIYNFGDSNSDTGAASAAFGRLPPPYGETFFGKPSGRYSDGRLVIDFTAEHLGLPLLNAYLDSIGSNFSHGANFAASGSTMQPVNAKLYEAGFNPLSLNVQRLEFEQLKDRTEEIYAQAEGSQITSNLPKPGDFSKALYTLDSGQNDLHYGLMKLTMKQLKESIPYIINQFSLSIEKLYQKGARIFWIHNTGPIGCLPFFVITTPPKREDTDQSGCINSYNEVAQEFNKQLKEQVSKLRTQLSGVALYYVDIYTVKYSLIREANKYGFLSPFGYCCRHYGDSSLRCWEKEIRNGTEIFATSCSDPLKYISWDGIHYTEAANKWIANHILDGSFSDPPVPLGKTCRSPGFSN